MNMIRQEPKNRMSWLSRIKYFSIPNTIRITIMIILILFLILSGFYWYIVENHQKFIDKKESVFSYSNKADVSYEVCYNENEVITEKRVEQDKVYISEFIYFIDTAYNYEFNGDKIAELNGKYSAIAYLQGLVRGLDGEKIIWSKEYILLPESKFSNENKTVAVKYNVPIKLKEMKEYSDKVKSILKFNTNVKLTVLYNISVEIKTDKGITHEEFAPSLEIPITQEYFEITKNITEEKTGGIDEEVRVISPLYEQKRIFCWILLVLSMLGILFVVLFTETLVLDPKHKEFVKIFKNYGSRIVVLNYDVKLETKKTIKVTTINGLVRISDDLGKPILYDGNYNFYVIDDIDYIFNLGKETDDSADLSLKII